MKKILLVLITVLLTVKIYSQDGFGSIFDSEEVAEESINPITISGELGIKYKTYFDASRDSERLVFPFAGLKMMFVSDTVEGKIALNLDTGYLDSNISMRTLIDELSLRSFFSFGYLDLGLLKTEWGKGDGIHVIDPLNPLDQTDGPSSDINKMKRSELMAKMNFYLGDRGLLELVYKPYFHSLTTASQGRWVVKDLSVLPNLQTPFPDTETPSYSQAAARATMSVGNFDLGTSYYYGYMTEPGFKLTTTLTGLNPDNPADYTTTTDLVNTKAQLFGIEVGGVIGPFTFRTEGGYWLSEDHEGNEAHLYNDRAVWLAGFDIMIPGTSVFLSIQEFGSYVLNFDNSNPMDVDLGMSYKKNAVTNTIIAAVESSFFRDKMKLRLAGLYLFEANGYMFRTTYIWDIKDDLGLSIEGQVYGGDDEGPNPYYAWRNNDSLTISLKYIF